MEIKKTILIYQYAERLKSELIIASTLMARLILLKDRERQGAEAMMTAFFEALLGEIRIAQGDDEPDHFTKPGKKIMEAIEKLAVSDITGVNRCIAEAVSAATTVCQEKMKELENNNLI